MLSYLFNKPNSSTPSITCPTLTNHLLGLSDILHNWEGIMDCGHYKDFLRFLAEICILGYSDICFSFKWVSRDSGVRNVLQGIGVVTD